MDSNKNIVRIQSDNSKIISGIKLVAEFCQFAQWSATPRQFRELKTQKEFAASIGVDEDTLSIWKHHPKFWTITQSAIRLWIRERVPDVLGAVYNSAMGAGAKQAGVFLRAAGMLDNKK